MKFARHGVAFEFLLVRLFRGESGRHENGGACHGRPAQPIHVQPPTIPIPIGLFPFHDA
jgi:hypothetical protein